MCLDGEAVVIGKVQKLGLQFLLRESDLLHIVIQNIARPAAQKSKSVLVTLQEGG